MRIVLRRFLGVVALATFCAICFSSLAFTYQGRLTDGPNPANGIYDFQFTLYDSATEGNAVDETLSYPDTSVSNGRFNVVLDFNARSFDGNVRWLEIAVCTNGAQGFSTLSPRVEITPTPYALQALNVASNAIAGAYGESVTFNHPDNIFVGNFTGNGGALTNVDAATFGGLSVTNLWQMYSNAVAATATGTTNVFAGGHVNTTTVTASNISTIIPQNVLSNANAFVGFGGIQLPTTWYGTPEGMGNARASGIEWWQTGWDGTPAGPDDYSSIAQAFIQVRRNWGQVGSLNTFNDRPTMHIASKGDIRIEPNFGGRPDQYWGLQYLSLGNEDVGSMIYVNYFRGSVFIHHGYPGNGTNAYDGAWKGGIKPWAKGYGLPLMFPASGTHDSVEFTSNPAIWSHSADTNASAAKEFGELWFMSRGPTFDYWQPTVGEQNDPGLVVFKMKTNHVEFLLGGIKTDTIRAQSGSTVTVSNNLNVTGTVNASSFGGRLVFEQSSITAANNTNYFLDFNSASFSTIKLTSTMTNRFYVTNLVTAANEFQPRTYRILSGSSNRPLRWPTNWSVVTESGNGTLPTLLVAKRVLHLRLESWGPSESNIVARFATGTDKSD